MSHKASRFLAFSFRVCICVIILTAGRARADDDDHAPPTSTSAPTDKNAYNLFNPTPREQMRDFNSDRPDTTESPYTIDAGHLQVESSFAEYTLDHEPGSPSGTRTQTTSVLPTNFRIGVLNTVEADVIVSPVVYQRTQTGNSTHYADGFGDTQLRAKINLLGDDGGPIALGLIPFVQLPTASESSGLGTGHVQGGLIFPVQFNLPHDWSIGAMAEVDFDRNDDNTGYGVAFVHSIVLDHPIWQKLEGYIEYVGIAPDRLGQQYQAFVDTGASYEIVDDVQVDCGVQFGISHGTPDYTIVAGITVRI